MIGSDGVSAQALFDTIGAIYDCALDPHPWPDTCRRIASLCESTAGGICVHDLRHTQNDQLFVFGYEMDFLKTLGAHYAQSPMAAADMLGISEPTVRTHLQRIFSKTDTTRQANLLRLLPNATPPIQYKAQGYPPLVDSLRKNLTFTMRQAWQ